MERTHTDGGIIHVGEVEFTRLLVQLIRKHKFHNNNEYPTKIVLPSITEIEGVIIKQEVRDAVGSGTTDS